MHTARLLNALNLSVRALVLAFMLLPAVTVLVMSFSNNPQLTFPPTRFGVRQYLAFFSSPRWIGNIVTSFEVAVPACVIALAVGLPVVLAVYRSRMPLKALLSALGIAPILLPGVAYAVAMYTLFVRLRVLGSIWALILADAMLVMPFIVIVLSSAIVRVPRELELAAMSLGASRRRAIGGITVRLLLPGIVAAFALAFITAFDEAVFVNFLAGDGITTLPKGVFNSLRTGLDPVITAIASVFMVLTALVLVVVAWLRRLPAASR